MVQADPIHERWRAKAEWKSMNEEQKLRKIISVTIAGLAILLLFYMMLNMRSYDNTSVLSYIVHKKWEKVPNVFSFRTETAQDNQCDDCRTGHTASVLYDAEYAKL